MAARRVGTSGLAALMIAISTLIDLFTGRVLLFGPAAGFESTVSPLIFLLPVLVCAFHF